MHLQEQAEGTSHYFTNNIQVKGEGWTDNSHPGDKSSGSSVLCRLRSAALCVMQELGLMTLS